MFQFFLSLKLRRWQSCLLVTLGSWHLERSCSTSIFYSIANGVENTWYCRKYKRKPQQWMTKWKKILSDRSIFKSGFLGQNTGRSVISNLLKKIIEKDWMLEEKPRFHVFAGSKSSSLDWQSYDVMQSTKTIFAGSYRCEELAPRLLSWSATKHLPWCNSFRYEWT